MGMSLPTRLPRSQLSRALRCSKRLRGLTQSKGKAEGKLKEALLG